MRPILFLLRRYLLPKEGNLLAFALWISIVGVALGISVLMLVLSVMSGFQNFLQNRYTRITSELVVLPKHSAKTRVAEKLKSTAGVEKITPFVMGQGMIFNKGVGGAVLEGIDLPTTKDVTPWDQIWQSEPNLDLQKTNPNWIWLGKNLSEKLKAKVGDTVTVMIGEGGKKDVPFTVTAITKFGIYDHDLRYAYADINVLKNYFLKPDSEPMYKIKRASGTDLTALAENVRVALGPLAGVRKWNELNKNVFLAVADQKRMLFIVLLVIVALAGVNVINLLMMSSHHRRRDTAILRTMGMGFKGTMVFFIAQGTIVSTIGICLGVGFGYVLVHLVERFQPPLLSEAIYNVTKLPLSIEIMDVVAICVVTFFLSILFSVLPGLSAARQRPVNTLRVE